MDSLKKAWNALFTDKGSLPRLSTGPSLSTGRTPSEPEPQYIPYPHPSGVRSSEADTVPPLSLNFDFVTLERRVAQLMLDEAALSNWLVGKNPNLKVQFTVDGPNLYVNKGEASYNLGTDTSALERAGYRVEIVHRRDYYNPITEEVVRLRKDQARYVIPNHATFFYGDSDEEGEDVDFESVNPLTFGGDSRVRIFTPTGLGAEGFAFCLPDEPFNRAYGRSLAFVRAIAILNEAMR